MEIQAGTQNACGCRAMHSPKFLSTPGATDPTAKLSEDSKYFQEIGAEMIGNQLIIRVEKDGNRSAKRKAAQWDPPCDCNIPEIRMPSSTEGPKIMNAGDNNEILFRIASRTLVGQDDVNYRPEAFAYQLGAAKKGKDGNEQLRTITVHPNLSDPSGSQDVHSDHITDGNQNIYLLRIKKKVETPSKRRRNIELELRTPKPQTPPSMTKVSSRKLDVPKPQPEVEMKVETVNDAKQTGGEKKKNKKKKKK